MEIEQKWSDQNLYIPKKKKELSIRENDEQENRFRKNRGEKRTK